MKNLFGLSLVIKIYFYFLSETIDKLMVRMSGKRYVFLLLIVMLISLTIMKKGMAGFKHFKIQVLYDPTVHVKVKKISVSKRHTCDNLHRSRKYGGK